MSEANDAVVNEQFVDLPNDEYILQTVNIDNIIKELNLNNDDADITRSIILNLEADAADAISNNVIASLPYVGNIQKNLIRQTMHGHNAELQMAKKQMTKEEYKEYAKEVRKQVREKIVSDYRERKIIHKLKKGSSKKYRKLVFEKGKAYADLYIQALFWLKAVEYNPDVQKQYDIINGVI